MKLKKLIITFFLLPAAFGYAQTQSTQIIAHRGFWKTNGSAQNSIAALMKADSVGCYGSEFDVWLTDDDQLVVNWSSVFKGVNMQESTVKECTAIVLDNGEHLPTLQEYLEKARNLKTRLILELKAHKTREQETRAVKKILKKGHGVGRSYGIHYFLTSCCQRIYSPCPQGNPGLLSRRRPISQRIKRMGMYRTKLPLKCVPATSRMD